MIPDSFDWVWSSRFVSCMPMNKSTVLIVTRPRSFDAIENISWGFSNTMMLNYVLETLEREQGIDQVLGTKFFVRNTIKHYSHRLAAIGMLAAAQRVGHLIDVTVGSRDWSMTLNSIKHWLESEI